jgi:hypothetical protein
MEEKFGIYVTKIGNIAIGYIGKYVTSIKIINNEDKNEINKYIDNRNKITYDTYMQIQEYLKGKRKSFDICYMMKGTEFQEKVWKELLKIPYGETKSYKEIAEKIGKPKSYRAVRKCKQ